MPSPKDDKYDAGSRDQIRQKKDRSKLVADKRANELKQVLSSYEGRSVLWHIMEDCGIYKTSFTGNSETFFREGKRRVGLDLLIEIDKADPEAYAKMRAEAIERAEGRKL